MKFLVLFALAASAVNAADSNDVQFLTNLVNDYKGHTKDYAGFIRTAKSVPAALTSLALQVATYTDDSYTALLNKDGLDVDSLENFATELPWYSSRLAKEGTTKSTKKSTSSKSSSKSSSAKTSSTITPVEASTTDESNDESTSGYVYTVNPTFSESISSISDDGSGALIAPVCAFLGAIAVALL